MQTLIFGDSLTFGFEAPGKQRDHKKRWSWKIIMNNPEHEIIVNGVCGRSLKAIKDERKNTIFDGQYDVQNFLNANWNADRIVVFLGGNDLVHGQLKNIDEYKEHLNSIVSNIEERTSWKKERFEIVLVVPPAFGDKVQDDYKSQFEGNLIDAYKDIKYKVINLNEKVKAQSLGKPNTDGVHMTDEEDEVILSILQKELF